MQLFRIYPTGVSGTDAHMTLYATQDAIAAAGRDSIAVAFHLGAGIVESKDSAAAPYALQVLSLAPPDFRIRYGSKEIALQHYQRHIAEAIGMPLE